MEWIRFLHPPTSVTILYLSNALISWVLLVPANVHHPTHSCQVGNSSRVGYLARRDVSVTRLTNGKHGRGGSFCRAVPTYRAEGDMSNTTYQQLELPEYPSPAKILVLSRIRQLTLTNAPSPPAAWFHRQTSSLFSSRGSAPETSSPLGYLRTRTQPALFLTIDRSKSLSAIRSHGAGSPTAGRRPAGDGRRAADACRGRHHVGPQQLLRGARRLRPRLHGLLGL